MVATESKYGTVRKRVLPFARSFLTDDWLPNAHALSQNGKVVVPFAFPILQTDKEILAAGFSTTAAMIWSDTECMDQDNLPADKGFSEFFGESIGDVDSLIAVTNSASLVHHAIIVNDGAFCYFSDADLFAFYVAPVESVASTIMADAWARFALRWAGVVPHEEAFFRRFARAALTPDA